MYKFSLDRAYCYIEEGRSQLHDSGRAPHWNILRAKFWSSAVRLSSFYQVCTDSADAGNPVGPTDSNIGEAGPADEQP